MMSFSSCLTLGIRGLVVTVLLGIMGHNTLSTAAPLPGQIIVDPDNPSWLKYTEGSPFFMCGPGDPEAFLYRGVRHANGTRSGDQMALINKLQGTGANSIYLMAVRSHGGDGDRSHNPFIDSNPAKGLDQDILGQWETWFAEMDKHGIMIFFFFYDDSTRIWNTGSTVGKEERAFIRTLVNRFKHHKHLIWVVAEEYAERYSAARVSNIAAEIRAADDHEHVIAVHKNHGLDFSEFANDPNINQFAIQYNVSTAAQLHTGVVKAWNKAQSRYNPNMSEAFAHGTGATARKKNWAIAMGGAYVMVLGWSIDNTSISDLKSCGHLRRFMESTNFNEMSPHDELKHGGTEYVLALPGESYIAYASHLVNDMGLKDMTAGTYDFQWYDIAEDNSVVQSNVRVVAGNHTWRKPSNIGNELAVYVKRSSTGVNRSLKLLSEAGMAEVNNIVPPSPLTAVTGTVPLNPPAALRVE